LREGEEIIGVYGSNQKAEYTLPLLGFIAWTPN
jgi:hypothetical protein